MSPLGGRGSAPGKNPWDDHQAVCPDFLGMSGMGHRLCRILSARAYHGGYAGFNLWAQSASSIGPYAQSIAGNENQGS